MNILTSKESIKFIKIYIYCVSLYLTINICLTTFYSTFMTIQLLNEVHLCQSEKLFIINEAAWFYPMKHPKIFQSKGLFTQKCNDVIIYSPF